MPSFPLFRSTRLALAAGFASLAILSVAGCAKPAAKSMSRDYLVYFGTNVSGEQENSIFLYRLTTANGLLTPVGAYRGGASPTYLTMPAGRRFLYAVSETQTFQGAKGGGVSALGVDQHTGGLTLLNQQPSTGASPCYISLDRAEKAALVANYVGGNVAMLPIAPNGQLSAPSATDQHQGSGPHKNQTTAHAHCILPDPANTFAFAVDLGTDQVVGYRLGAAKGELTRLPEPAFTAKPGAGPRHLVFHPNGRQAYLINELNSTLTALAYDASAGKFKELQTVSTLPKSFTGENSCADVHVSPDGLFLYASNRGHNSIAVFAIDTNNGTLAPIQHMSTQGKTPRNFALTPSGHLLLVANQNSNNVVTFRVDGQNGLLAPTGQTIEVPSPMFVQIVEDFTR